MELYGKTEVAARSRQLAALLRGCNPPKGWPKASTVCHGKYSGMSFALQFAIAYSSTAHTSEIILYAFCKFGEFLLGYSVRFLTCNPLARKFVY